MTPDSVAAMPPAMPTTEAATAPQPIRFSPWRVAQAPAAMPASPSTTVGIGERIVSGGSATNSARKASATPAQPTVRPVSQPCRSVGSAAGAWRGAVTVMPAPPPSAAAPRRRSFPRSRHR